MSQCSEKNLYHKTDISPIHSPIEKKIGYSLFRCVEVTDIVALQILVILSDDCIVYVNSAKSHGSSFSVGKPYYDPFTTLPIALQRWDARTQRYDERSRNNGVITVYDNNNIKFGYEWRNARNWYCENMKIQRL